MRNKLLVTIKGVCVGGSLLVPGVSGGSMAMILGIYQDLISSVSSFLKQKRRNLLFLTFFGIGALGGILLFAKPLLALIERYPKPTLFFFLGAVAGGIPMIFRKAEIRSIRPTVVLYPLCGAALVLLLGYLPEGLFQAPEGTAGVLMLILAGLVAAVALVLPGISVSYMFLVLGMYDHIMGAITQLSFSYLLPLGIGLVLGIILTTRMLERLMDRHTQPTYLFILGFILGSLPQVFPGLPVQWEWIICIPLFLAGMLGIWKLSSLE